MGGLMNLLTKVIQRVFIGVIVNHRSINTQRPRFDGRCEARRLHRNLRIHLGETVRE